MVHDDYGITPVPGRSLPVSQVSHWVLIDPDIPPQSKSLYALLSGHCFGAKTATNVTQSSLAAMMGWSRRQTVAKWLAPLIEAGAVDAQSYTCPRTGAQRYTYVIHQTPPAGYTRPQGIAEWYAANRKTGGDVVTAGRVDETAGRDLVRERAHASEKTDKPDNQVRERARGQVRERAHKEQELKNKRKIMAGVSDHAEAPDSPGDNDQQQHPKSGARERAAAILRTAIPARWSETMTPQHRTAILDTATQILAEARHSARARVEDTVTAAMGDDGTYAGTRGRQIADALAAMLQTVRSENSTATKCRNCLPDTPCIMHRPRQAATSQRQRWPILPRLGEVSLMEIIATGAISERQVADCIDDATDRDSAQYRVAQLLDGAGTGDEGARSMMQAWVRIYAPMRAHSASR